ncbi:MAG TPA: hypothetical protein VI759_10880, partial [Dehalococcoidia bacterium]|nr:hypothetical protein [Dehalococcoidia bacterium]
MATVLLAIGDAALLMACRAHLQASGHTAVALDRPLAALSLALKLAWTVVLIDSSPLGRETLRTLVGRRDRSPRIGIGFDSAALDF